MGLSPGPYGLIFASFIPFYCDIPTTTRLRMFGVSFSDKSFVYIAGLQVLIDICMIGIELCLTPCLSLQIYDCHFLSAFVFLMETVIDSWHLWVAGWGHLSCKCVWDSAYQSKKVVMIFFVHLHINKWFLFQTSSSLKYWLWQLAAFSGHCFRE
mgnify:FL=1